MAVNSQWYFDWISAQMTRSQAYANESYDTAMDYLETLSNFVAGEIDTTPPAINIDPPGSIIIDPTILAQMPAAPTDYPNEPPAEPSFSEHDFPAAPVFTMPSVPVVNDIAIPGFVSNDIVGISASLPVFTASVPAISAIPDGGDVPEDSLVQTVKARLESNILNGGTMLSADIEADIFNRDLERREQILQDLKDKITAQWAKLNWSLPDGLLAGMLMAADIEYTNKNLESSRTIAIEQAKLEQSGVFKSMELGISLENIIMDSHNKYAARVLEASKSTAQVTIQLFKE